MNSLIKKRHRAIVKVLCLSCLDQKSRGVLGMNCGMCQFIKYNNVGKLTRFVNDMDRLHPDWVWIKIYDYHKDHSNGRELATYKNWYNTYIMVDGMKVKTGQTRDLPTRDYIQ